MRKKEYRKVELTCVDIISYEKGIWKPEELELPEVKIVGYLWFKDKEKVALKRIEGHPEDEPILIPLGCVKKMTYLKEVK